MFISDEFGAALTVIDADKNSVLGRIELAGEAGNVRFDPISARIYVPLQSRGELAVIDPATLTVIGAVKLPGGEHFPLADLKGRAMLRAFDRR